MKKTLIILLGICALFTSCVTNKKLNYLQTADTLNDTTHIKASEARPYILRAGDELYIDIKPLYEGGARAFQAGTTGTSSQRMTSAASYYYTYPIYEDGTVDYPYIGKIKVAGLTMEEVRAKFEVELEEYIEGMTMVIKLATNYVNIIGEVSNPGRKQITTEKLNLFEALALAGDLDPYGNRSEIKLIRETKEGPVIKTFDMRRDDIINSEYYWIQPGDVIYVSRIKGQFFKLDSFSDIMVIFSSSLSIIILALSF